MQTEKTPAKKKENPNMKAEAHNRHERPLLEEASHGDRQRGPIADRRTSIIKGVNGLCGINDTNTSGLRQKLQADVGVSHFPYFEELMIRTTQIHAGVDAFQNPTSRGAIKTTEICYLPISFKHRLTGLLRWRGRSPPGGRFGGAKRAAVRGRRQVKLLRSDSCQKNGRRAMHDRRLRQGRSRSRRDRRQKATNRRSRPARRNRRRRSRRRSSRRRRGRLNKGRRHRRLRGRLDKSRRRGVRSRRRGRR